jgi:UDP-N-acetylglucosamine--N-acetylmuramyl-(pentapeptide) pyrophosphoryl-undecaprenol N-acetylglucosamine transferase
VTARVEPFIDDMAAAYGWADLVVCRAGALTVAELAAAGVGAVLVPYPHAVDDHQTRNAAYLSDVGAAVVIQQAELTRERLRELWSSLADRSRLLTMARAARSLAQPQAAATVAALCWEAAHG